MSKNLKWTNLTKYLLAKIQYWLRIEIQTVTTTLPASSRWVRALRAEE